MLRKIASVLWGAVAVLACITTVFYRVNSIIPETGQVSRISIDRDMMYPLYGSRKIINDSSTEGRHLITWANEFCPVMQVNDTLCAPLIAVIGAQKSGTTTLTHCLAQHPFIRMRTRELHFFEQRGLSLLSARSILSRLQRQIGPLPLAKRKNTATNQEVSGFDRPEYLATPWTPSTLKRVWPALRSVAILKHPVERTYSAFHHHLTQQVYPARGGNRSVDGCCPVNMELAECFHECVKEEVGSLSGILVDYERNWTEKRVVCPPRNYYTKVHDSLCQQFNRTVDCSGNIFGAFPVLMSLYDLQLCNWRDHFDAHQMLVVWFDDVLNKKEKVIRDVENHIGVPPMDGTTMDKVILIRRGSRRSSFRPSMLWETRKMLGDFFTSHLERLGALLGKIPPHWQSNGTRLTER